MIYEPITIPGQELSIFISLIYAISKFNGRAERSLGIDFKHIRIEVLYMSDTVEQFSIEFIKMGGFCTECICFCYLLVLYCLSY